MRLTRMRIARRKVRRIGLRHKTIVAAVGGILAVVPAALFSGGATGWSATPSAEGTRDAALVGGFDPRLVRLSVDGTLPQSASVTEPLQQYQLPDGPLGIPGTALKAYHNAADILATEQPNCHIDWALIASIGRIESNHARGGYLDVHGNTLAPILGPELNGVGDVAAIPDTDGGRWDHDLVWDRAVGPTQFIPSTWNYWGADGNGDGLADPGNIYDATLATARYLCSGGLDLSDPDQVRAAVYRYNNSDVYVNTVILWADAYRNGVLTLPDSQVPIDAPTAPPVTGPPPAPQAPVVTPPPASTGGGTPAHPTTQASTPEGPGGTTPPPAGAPTSPTSPTSPTCPTPTSSSPSTTTTTTTSPSGTPDPCAPPATDTTTTSSTTSPMTTT